MRGSSEFRQEYLARILGARQAFSQDGGVTKTIYSRQAECLREAIIKLRKKAGLNQRQLAAKLGRERNLVGRLEVGQRRLDLIEFYWVCRACNADPKDVVLDVLSQFEKVRVSS